MPRTARRVRLAKALLFAKSLPLRKSYFSRTCPARSISRNPRGFLYHVQQSCSISRALCALYHVCLWRSISRRHSRHDQALRAVTIKNRADLTKGSVFYSSLCFFSRLVNNEGNAVSVRLGYLIVVEECLDIDNVTRLERLCDSINLAICAGKVALYNEGIGLVTVGYGKVNIGAVLA